MLEKKNEKYFTEKVVFNVTKIFTTAVYLISGLARGISYKYKA